MLARAWRMRIENGDDEARPGTGVRLGEGSGSRSLTNSWPSRQSPAMDIDAALVARELRDREPLFHRPEHGTARADFEAMTDIDYWEVGASGTIYDRQTIFDVLERRYADPTYDPMAGLEVSDFEVREAGDDVWLATYGLRQGERNTRRVSVWRRTGTDWILVYHQGTVVSPGS